MLLAHIIGPKSWVFGQISCFSFDGIKTPQGEGDA